MSAFMHVACRIIYTFVMQKKRDKRNMSSEEYYHQGNEHRRQGDFPAAMNCYLQAIALDPDSPAVVAEKMLEDIMNFYCKDIYNP